MAVKRGIRDRATLQIEAPVAASGKVTFNARLKDDGTLTGTLSSEMGDMTWTATRER